MAVFPVVVVVVLRLIVILILTIGFRRVRAASPFPHALRWLCCCDGHMTSPFSVSPVALCSPFPYPLTHFILSLPSSPPCYTASVNTAIYFMHNSLCAQQMVSYVFMMVTRQLLSSFPSPFPFAALPLSLSPYLPVPLRPLIYSHCTAIANCALRYL